MRTVRVFKYVEPLDAFVASDEYKSVAERIGLAEWNPVVWIGRLFTLDNDYGEHWFDNWEQREALEERAMELDLGAEELLVIVPDRLQDGKDGPCHTPEFRKRFWTDVLKSLELSYDLMFDEARAMNEVMKKYAPPEEQIPDLEERIDAISRELGIA